MRSNDTRLLIGDLKVGGLTKLGNIPVFRVQLELGLISELADFEL